MPHGKQNLETPKQSTWLDRFNAARKQRCVLTREELWCAMQEFMSPEDAAACNDVAAAEYDSAEGGAS